MGLMGSRGGSWARIPGACDGRVEVKFSPVRFIGFSGTEPHVTAQVIL